MAELRSSPPPTLRGYCIPNVRTKPFSIHHHTMYTALQPKITASMSHLRIVRIIFKSTDDSQHHFGQETPIYSWIYLVTPFLLPMQRHRHTKTLSPSNPWFGLRSVQIHTLTVQRRPCTPSHGRKRKKAKDDLQIFRKLMWTPPSRVANPGLHQPLPIPSSIDHKTRRIIIAVEFSAQNAQKSEQMPRPAGMESRCEGVLVPVSRP